MSSARHTRLLIIGSGPAGYTAAVYGARAMLEPILIQGIQPGGQLTITTEVENWPGDTEVQGPDLMLRMEAHAKATGAEIIADHISALDLSRRPFTAAGDSDRLCAIEGARFVVPPAMRAFTRIVAARFDAYLNASEVRYSKAV